MKTKSLRELRKVLSESRNSALKSLKLWVFLNHVCMFKISSSCYSFFVIMGEEDGQSDKLEAAANGNDKLEEKSEVVTEKKGEENNGVTEMEEDIKGDGKDESKNMEVDKVQINESKETEEKEAENGIGEKYEKEESKDKKQMEETKGEEEKEETKSEGKEDESSKKPDDEAEDKVEGDVDEVNAEEGEPEENKEVKGSKKQPRTKSRSGQKDKSKKKKAEEEKLEAPIEKKAKQTKTPTRKMEEPKTTTPYAIERPVRERKSVERLVATIEKDNAKDFQIEEGRGTALKDIPNVAYKLLRRKTDDTFKLLHTILFGRRGKAAQVKNNISNFSGFVWPDNEEKQMIKVKEKLDKCVKEKLVEFCDVLDLQIPKANTRKEDIIAKLIEFLMAPHATTTELLAEKEQSSKGKKRKRDGKRSESEIGSTPSQGSAKSQKRGSKNNEENKSILETEDESEEEKEEMHEEENIDDASEKSEEEISEHAESKKESESEDDESVKYRGKQKRSSTKSPAKKKSAEKGKIKKVALAKKASPPTKKARAKSTSRSKYSNDNSAKKSSGKQKGEALEEKSTTSKKSAPKESTGKKAVKGKLKPKEDKLKPSDDELKSATCEILKEVDFDTATFTDILKQLAKQFSTDLTPRKSSIKLMIQEELTKLAGRSDDEGDAEKDGKKPARRSAVA
ncbi:protein DEK-like isoform X1 [Olea europaea var. sylvestris]|uniref:protein DEK-like isoform X1 n=2 Tax=Olea europaea var. sylvestris TaxID=158386 RepID=UPI000C1CD5E7|nr:protein DEK-like isoform X1 [Olea europaea var. sylvestris]